MGFNSCSRFQPCSFPPCSRFFWDALPGEKHALILANTEHTLISSIAKLVKAIAAFRLSVMDSQRAHDSAGGSEKVTNQGGGRNVSNQGGTESVPNQGGADSASREGGGESATKSRGGENASDQGGTEKASNQGVGAGSGASFGAHVSRKTNRNRGEGNPGLQVSGLVEEQRGRNTVWGPPGDASEVGGEISAEEEGGDEEVRPNVYRLCGTAEGLRAVYRSLLDESRPWRFRWLEGILNAFGGEDVARWRGGGGEGEGNPGGKTAVFHGVNNGVTAGLNGENPLRLPSEAVQGESHEKRGETAGLARSQGGGNGTDAGGESGSSLALPSEGTQEVELSQEEKDWEREYAKQVQAREGGLLQLAEPHAGNPLGGGPGRARPRYRYELHRGEGRIELFCTDVPQKIIQW